MDLYSKSVKGTNLTLLYPKQMESQNYFGLNQAVEFQIYFGIIFPLKNPRRGSKEPVPCGRALSTFGDARALSSSVLSA